MTVPAASQHMRQVIPDAQLQPVDGGHLGYWEVAPSVTPAILAFANRIFAEHSSNRRAEFELNFGHMRHAPAFPRTQCSGGSNACENVCHRLAEGISGI